MKRLQIAAMSFVLLLGTFSTVKAQTADEIVKKHLEATGGIANWKKINTIKMVGSVNVQGQKIDMVFTTVNGKGARQDINIGGMANYSILTPTAGWQYYPVGGQTKPEAMTAEDVKDGQDELDIQGPLVDYQAKGNKVEYLGKDDVEGTECYKLKVTFKTGKEETMYLDASNYYQIRSVTKANVNGKEVEQTINYSNYQKLPAGIMYPMTVGSEQGAVTFTSVEVNKPVDESIFKPSN
ncbi:MAG: hypothetical protein ACTHJ0_10180 [Flavipsychrobacter sp.]